MIFPYQILYIQILTWPIAAGIQPVPLHVDSLSFWDMVLCPCAVKFGFNLLQSMLTVVIVCHTLPLCACDTLLTTCSSVCEQDLNSWLILHPLPSLLTLTHTHTHSYSCTHSRQAGQRVGGYLSSIVPLIMHFVQLDEENGDDELRESCLQAFEAFVLRCFREITPHIQGVREGEGEGVSE